VVQQADQIGQVIRKSTERVRRSKATTFKELHRRGILKRYATNSRGKDGRKLKKETGSNHVKKD
jgi:hypothetical protein